MGDKRPANCKLQNAMRLFDRYTWGMCKVPCRSFGELFDLFDAKYSLCTSNIAYYDIIGAWAYFTKKSKHISVHFKFIAVGYFLE